MPAQWGSCDGPLPGCSQPDFCSVPMWWKKGERKLSGSLLRRTLIPSRGRPKRKLPPKPAPPNTIMVGGRGALGSQRQILWHRSCSWEPGRKFGSLVGSLAISLAHSFSTDAAVLPWLDSVLGTGNTAGVRRAQLLLWWEHRPLKRRFQEEKSGWIAKRSIRS